MSTAATTINQDFSIQTASRSRDAVKYIFYAGNLMPMTLRSVPEHRLGGVLRHDIRTLGHRDGYIRQCEIVDCRQIMEAQWVGFVHPNERKHKATSYLLTENGQTRVIGKNSPDEAASFLYTPWYPEQDLGRVLAENVGIVEMPVTSAREAMEAQYFLFPNWDQILTGRESLPILIADLRAHFIERQREAFDPRMYAICDAAIRSCDQFEAEGHRAIARDNATFEIAKVKGWAWTYGSDAELYMTQLNVTRRDNLAAQSVSNVDKLAAVLEGAFQRGLLNVAAAPQPSPAATSPVEPANFPQPAPTESEDEEPIFIANVGGAALYKGKMGTITAMNKKTVTLETPEGEEFKAPLDEITVIAEPEE